MKLLRPVILLLAVAALGADSGVDYAREIKPIFRERCYPCHGALKQESELRLDTVSTMKTGGVSGAAIVPGDPEASYLVERISEPELLFRMPPEGDPLTPEQIDLIKRWIQQGAEAPADEKPEPDPRAHWAFQKPVRPTLPTGSSEAFPPPSNPIDAFIHARRDAAGMAPMPPADKAVLLRRVYLDLVGLPPSADEIQRFLKDDSPDAYERVVDRLLESPRHGERWARHWMDVWRYSDWYGRRTVPDVMNSYPMIWRWRDWIVRSVNEDKPYNRMVMEMLAADELYPADDTNLVATGFLVRSWFKWNYETWKKDLVEHTGKAFLGITLNCAQCHDHKYDPFTQKEYFQFRAFFEPLELRHDRVPGEPAPGRFKKYVYTETYGPIQSGMIRVFDEYLDAETYMFAKGDARLRIEGEPPVEPGVPAVLVENQLVPESITLPITAAYPGMKPFVIAEERASRQQAVDLAAAELEKLKNAPPSGAIPTAEESQAAELALQDAIKSAQQDIATGTATPATSVLEGKRSLALNAETGRRALAHLLPSLDALDGQGTVSFLVQLEQDGNTNLQLGLDIAQGATGGFVAFEQGTIKTYAPGGFQEIVVGKYDPAKGQNRFRVVMRLDIPRNQFLLTVAALDDDHVIVDAVPAALNGWKPQADGKRGLFIDCQAGTVAIYDALTFTQPDGTPLLAFNFEDELYSDGGEIAGTNGWMSTAYSVAPATSMVLSVVFLHPEVQSARARVAAFRQASRLPELALTAAEAKLDAAQIELESLELRVAADAARYATGLLSEDKKDDPAVLVKIHAAWRGEREAALAKAQADLALADAAIASAEVQQREAGERADKAMVDAATQALAAAKQQRAAAETALNAANANLSTEPGEYAALSPKYPQVTTGRRAVLAKWIASRENPLTARVAVNHIWLRHFGQALVETTSDFGRNGSPPTHPELLDWLACEFMDSGWSMKHIHRLIVTSQTYRMASMPARSSGRASKQFAELFETDPDNRTYWQFPTQRMEAEVVRDSLLAVAGVLDPTMGGHEIDPAQGQTSRRRSIYFAHHGEGTMKFLELFDAANTSECYRRRSSIRPQQALALNNSELTKQLSRELAAKLWTRVGSEPGNASTPAPEERYVSLAFLQVLNRAPRETELAASLDFLEQQTARLAPEGSNPLVADPVARSRENLIHALMNHNDFVTIR